MIRRLRLAEARIPQTKADLAATDEAIMLNKHALAALVGQGPDRALTIDRPAPASLQAQGLPAERRRSTSSAAVPTSPPRASRLEAAAERIKEARAAFYPNISISALAGLRRRSASAICSAAAPAFASVDPGDQPADLPRRLAPGPISRSPRRV